MTAMQAQLRTSGIVSPAPVAQLVELRPFKSEVVRSSRTGGTASPSVDALPARMRTKSRTSRANKTLCVHGHRLQGRNLIVKARPNGRTIRNCRICQLAAQRRAYRRRQMQPGGGR